MFRWVIWTYASSFEIFDLEFEYAIKIDLLHFLLTFNKYAGLRESLQGNLLEDLSKSSLVKGTFRPDCSDVRIPYPHSMLSSCLQVRLFWGDQDNTWADNRAKLTENSDVVLDSYASTID